VIDPGKQKATAIRGIAVLDVGSSNTKLTLFDTSLNSVEEEVVPSVHRAGPPYASIDPEAVVGFAARVLPEFDSVLPIDRIVPCAHGSGLACLDENGELALPIMDYEAEPPDEIVEGYARIEPPYAEVFAPTNPGALTLGRQLFWQESAFPEPFSRVKTIVPWGQYLGFRLSGALASEVTALGAQTHLWDVRANQYSALVRARGWEQLFAPLRPAFDTLGSLLPPIRGLGVRGDGRVLVGVHDSNANYLRYLASGIERFTLLSTGTWIIGFDSHARLEDLDARFDIVSNTTVMSQPVACCRFMGGREYQLVAAGAPPHAASVAALRRIVAAGIYALPSFTDSGGPMPGTGGKGKVVGPLSGTEAERATLALLYCALMSAESLGHVGVNGDIIVDGPFAESPLYCSVLAKLFPEHTVHASEVRNGTSVGAAVLALMRPDGRLPERPVELRRVDPLDVDELAGYRRRWFDAGKP